MLILLSKNKEIIKNYLQPNSNIGFIATASELEENRDYMYQDREYLYKMNYQAPLLNDYNAMNLVDFYILPHYKSKDKYTKLADEIEKEYNNYKFIKLSNNQAIVVDRVNNYKIVETE